MSTFKKLHQLNEPLLLCNVWDIPSTRIATELKFKALGTSSSAIASSLGKEDGENISFNTLVKRVESIVNHTNLPVSVDIESGYSDDPLHIAEHIKTLHKIGVCGINIEDSKIIKGVRTLQNINTFSNSLHTIKRTLKAQNINTFINVRTDAFLLNTNNKLADTQARISAYEQAGADGIFIPCLTQISDIEVLVHHTPLPINVMCMPDLTNFAQLQALGVKRISMGNFVYEAIHKNLKNHLQSIAKNQSFETLFTC